MGGERISEQGEHLHNLYRADDALGGKSHTNVLPTLRFISDLTSNNPENSGAIVCAPNTGEGVAYNEK